MVRYLVPFHPKRHPHFFTDVLVIGGGLSGFRAALAVDPSLQVLLICKNGLENSNSVYAQGGIASVWAKTDTPEEHIEDTIIAGGELCDRNVVERVVRRGPDEILNLLEIGTKFDKKVDGEILLGREGGHRNDRILHANGDSTGKELIRSMIEEIKRHPNIRIWENTFALDLLTANNNCCGAIVYWKKHDEKELIWAKQTILASGGIGQLYRETTNPEIATGDGIAMAHRAGAQIRDMEFVQFHPTVLYIAGSSRSLISEAMRGEGALLVDRKGNRFMPDYDDRAELAPRDVVSRSIVRQMEKTNSPNVYLDLTHKPADWVYARFPGIAATCRHFGIDIAKDRIPVRPGAHYSMGGVLVDIDGQSSLKGLWAIGEVSSTGLHGANRLASNSLLEALVFGESSGRLASQTIQRMTNDYQVESIENPPLPPLAQQQQQQQLQQSIYSPIDLTDIRNALKSLLWRTAGVVRNEDGLRGALEDTFHWSSYVFSQQFQSIEGWEIQNMLLVAQLILEGALQRRETRGAHNRSDYPKTLPNGQHSVK
ncbi:MAG: L-aspartate oxidase [Planctomycetaceae bacterium]|jgi:L-aspartate oxidase|nr:L-aspartate oxidase [Planctomycetaceae bacterium]